MNRPEGRPPSTMGARRHRVNLRRCPGGFDLEPDPEDCDIVRGANVVLAEPWSDGCAFLHYHNAERGVAASTVVSVPFGITPEDDERLAERAKADLRQPDLNLAERIAIGTIYAARFLLRVSPPFPSIGAPHG